VGRELIDLLRRAGSEVLFSDVSESTIRRFRDELGLPFVPPDEVYDAPCDVFAPCAVGGILNQGTIQRLQCRVVVGAANNQLARPEDADTLRDRGILYGPDFISNSGGAIAIVGMETRGWSLEEARERLVRSIKSNLSQVFDLSDAQGISPDAAAGRLAETRLEGKPQD
jgi:leucine dehydrogenase